MGYRILEGCPRCGRFPLNRSHLRGPLERFRQWLTGKSPYRCKACRWRGWAHDSWDRRQRVLDGGYRLGRRAEDKLPDPQANPAARAEDREPA